MIDVRRLDAAIDMDRHDIVAVLRGAAEPVSGAWLRDFEGIGALLRCAPAGGAADRSRAAM